MSAFLRWCSRCETNFTRANWQLHGHNPAQATCNVRDCRRKAVGHSGTEYTPRPLCGEHLINAQRNGSVVAFVDGRVCGVCDGEGQVQTWGTQTGSQSGQWRQCPECQGTGYDRILRPPSRSATAPRLQLRPPRSSGERLRPERGSSNPSGPRLALGATSVDIRAFERIRSRPNAQRARPRKVKFLFQATSAILSGAVAGILFVFPLLPDSAADAVIDIQQKVSAMFGK